MPGASEKAEAWASDLRDVFKELEKEMENLLIIHASMLQIGEILERTKRHEWRHVPGILNPADDASRGFPVGEMHSAHCYLCGTDFLLSEPSQWPQPPNDLFLSGSEKPGPGIRRWVGALHPEPSHST